MRTFTFLLLLLPIICHSQEASISIDTIGETGRIEFLGPTNNIYIGENSGSTTSTGINNVFVGRSNGILNTSGMRNLFLGSNAGEDNTTGSFNINLGTYAGARNATGIGNINIGDGAGFLDIIGDFNVRIGDLAGQQSTGSRNVLIGSNAGYSFEGDDQLLIDNTSTNLPLLHGFFLEDSLIINGNLNVTGTIIGNIDVSNVSGILGGGNSAVFPVVMDNTVSIEILGILALTEVLITNSVGYEIDTFTLFGTTCLDPNTGLSDEFPLTFETANASDISDLQAWFASPDARSASIIFEDVAGNETNRINIYEFFPSSTGPGTGGRTSFTLVNNLAPNNNVLVEINEYLGSTASYNPSTDKVVEIVGISHLDFCPSVQVDYAKRVITLEMTYNEGAGIVDWINSISDGTSTTKRTISIIETTGGPGTTEISRENFYEVLPFKYEVIYGFGLNTKVISRIKLIYGCNGPG